MQLFPEKECSSWFFLFPFSSMVLYASINFFSHDKSQRECVSLARILLALIARAEALFDHNFIVF